MSIQGHFQDFSQGPVGPAEPPVSGDDPLEGYEDGYKAGWDDATKAQHENSHHLGSVLQRNLEQIEFTVAEAQGQLLAALGPVMSEVTKTLLPGLTTEALRALISDELSRLMRDAMAADISLLVSETDRDAVTALLSSSPELAKIGLQTRDTLAEGQAYVTCKSKQRKIDVGDAIADIRKSLDEFINHPQLEHAHAS